MPDTLVRVKSKTAEAVVLEGYGVVWGGRDWYGETFLPSTELGLDLGDVKPVYFDHTIGPNPEPMNERIGKTVRIAQDDVGVWVEAVIDRRNEYVDALEELVTLNALGWSSGAPDHLVRVDPTSKVIKVWPIAEFSLTPTPAEARTFARAGTRKSVPVGVEDAKADVGERQSPAVVSVVNNEDTQMPEEIKQPESAVVDETPAMKALNEKMDKLATAMGVVMEQMEHSVKARDVGYWSPQGGTADVTAKSFGDLLQAALRKDTVRLDKVYGVKAMSEDAGVFGGVLVPEEYDTNIRKMTYTSEPWLSRLARTRVTTPAGSWPALDTYFTPTAGVGQAVQAGKVTSSKRAEAGSYTETSPQFVMFNWRVHDVISGYTKASKELVNDSPTAIEGLLTTLFGVADAAKQAYFFLHGTGSGEPLGILNSDAKITSTAAVANVFGAGDALTMSSKFLSVGGGEWLMHRTNMIDVGKLEVSAGGAAYMANTNVAPGSAPLYFYPITWSEHLPVTDNANSILLIDPSAYQVWELGGLEIGFSEHVAFLTGEVVWRFNRRLDGQPLFKGPIKQANPGTAHQVSPFVAYTFAT